jgi:hypothetical protein
MDLCMANSIVSALMRLLTPEVIGKIATTSGLDRSLAQTGIGAAAPAILSALTGLVGRPGGARQLADAVARQPADALSSITDGRSGLAQMAHRGTGLLTSLLGSGALGTLAATLARFAGIGEAPTRSLMGMLTPVIMGVLGNEQRAAGLDAAGLANMLTASANFSRQVDYTMRLHRQQRQKGAPTKRQCSERAPRPDRV